ncbi:diacylglycerol kinase family protein [Roseivirga sp. BDSF3-8]|uniref:diacylglycerol kinase family protein n=1 Tax=Roseivirga sp. BDSF3-8 TaxID=3241598 RepID=UPI003531C12C
MKSALASLRKTFLSFRFAIKGLRFLTRREHNFRFHLFAMGGTVIAGLFLDLPKTDWALIITMCGLVLGTEAINTSIEKLADHVCPEHHPAIGVIKDIAAAGVLIISLMALVVGLLVFIPALINY